MQTDGILVARLCGSARRLAGHRVDSGDAVAELRAVAARTDIAQRVLTILEPGQGPKSPVAARRYGS